jgi:hypothetical protein
MKKSETKLSEVKKWLTASARKAFDLAVLAELEENTKMADELYDACHALRNARDEMRKTPRRSVIPSRRKTNRRGGSK